MISSDIFNYSHKFLKGASRELIERHCTHWLVLILKQGLYFANRVRSQQHVSAYGNKCQPETRSMTFT